MPVIGRMTGGVSGSVLVNVDRFTRNRVRRNDCCDSIDRYGRHDFNSGRYRCDDCDCGSGRYRRVNDNRGNDRGNDRSNDIIFRRHDDPLQSKR